MNISFKIRNVEKVEKFLNSLPYGVKRVALEALSMWLVGDSQSGLRHPEPYKYVSRKSAYGYTGAKFESGKPVPAGYFSAEQYRYVMARIASGDIKPGQNNRTGKSTDAWTYAPTSKGKDYRYRLINNTPGAYYTRDDKGQARQPAKVGWWNVSKVVQKNLSDAIKAAKVAVNQFLAEKK